MANALLLLDINYEYLAYLMERIYATICCGSKDHNLQGWLCTCNK